MVDKQPTDDQDILPSADILEMAPKAGLESPYNAEAIRRDEYPMFKDVVYLDHAGKPPAAKSLIERFSKDMTTNLYGNPHSTSASSQLSTHGIEAVRLAALKLFNADPGDFDLVFVANATAGIKLLTECLRGRAGGYWYGYHRDAHNSLIGAREDAAGGSHCFETDAEVDKWLNMKQATPAIHHPVRHSHEAHAPTPHDSGISTPVSYGTESTRRSPASSISSAPDVDLTEPLELLAWPAQSNMNSWRLPLSWAKAARNSYPRRRYTLHDAASYVCTSPLDLSKADEAPDFTVLSFYKMFGFPEIGALIVRKASAHLLRHRRYFGGGTVDMVSTLKEQWRVNKTSSIHASLEDGTLPIYNILALGHAIEVHKKLYGSFANVSKHTSTLAQRLHPKLSNLQHANGKPVTEMYTSMKDPSKQGPNIAFNILDSSGNYVSPSDVDRLASLCHIHLRVGSLCNPGGVASSLGIGPEDLRRYAAAGIRCGSNDPVNGKATGMIRVSLGAMSTASDLDKLMKFITEHFVETKLPRPPKEPATPNVRRRKTIATVEQLIVYPIKSCAGFAVPPNTDWTLRSGGLAWDREWCVVNVASNDVLTQKRCPRMALITPHLDFARRQLQVQIRGKTSFSVALDANASSTEPVKTNNCEASICGDIVALRSTIDAEIDRRLSDFLGVPCSLARFSSMPSNTTRHTKPHLTTGPAAPLVLTNESPILAITRQSLDKLNKDIAARSPGADAIDAGVFRPNIILSSSAGAYDEDNWTALTTTPTATPTATNPSTSNTPAIHKPCIQILGPCRRCQITCTDLVTGERRKNAEPLATLTRTRKLPGVGPVFGVHMRLDGEGGSLRVGEALGVSVCGEEEVQNSEIEEIEEAPNHGLVVEHGTEKQPQAQNDKRSGLRRMMSRGLWAFRGRAS